MKNKVMFLSLFLTGIAFSILAQEKTPRTLRFISDFSSPPFSYEEGLQRKGFEVELAEALGNELGAKVEWIKQSFNIPTFSSTLEVKGADAVISSISITEDRGKYFSFTRSYFRTSLAAAILKEFKDFAKRFDRRLEKAIVGVMKGTTGQKWVRNNLGPQRVNTYDSPDRLARALKNRDVEVIFLDRAILDYLLSHHSYRFLIAREGLEHENYGIALSKGNQELLSELNAGLEKLDESGVYDEIYNKWFGPSRSLP